MALAFRSGMKAETAGLLLGWRHNANTMRVWCGHKIANVFAKTNIDAESVIAKH